MPFTVTTPPSVEPITTAEAKSHLNVTGSADDAYIDTLIQAAREYAEGFTRRAFITQAITAKFDAFPAWFELECGPLQSITSIQYIDTAGNTQTLVASNYTVDTTSTPGRITEAYAVSWPSTRDIVNAVTVTYVAGYGAASAAVPQPIIQAMLFHIGYFFDNREGGDVPQIVKTLLMPYKVY